MHKQCQQKRKEKDWGVEHQCFRPTCCGQSGWPTWCHNITLDVQVKGIFEIIHSMCCCWSWRSLETMLLVICVTMAHFDLLLAWKKKWETLEVRWHDVIELRPTWAMRKTERLFSIHFFCGVLCTTIHCKRRNFLCIWKKMRIFIKTSFAENAKSLPRHRPTWNQYWDEIYLWRIETSLNRNQTHSKVSEGRPSNQERHSNAKFYACLE